MIVELDQPQLDAASRRDLITRLLACLADADRLPGASRAAAEISQAIEHLGGDAPPSVECFEPRVR